MLTQVATTAERRPEASYRQYLSAKYAGMACLLNGRPAKIVGRLSPVASVVELGGATEAQWPWETVQNVMTRLGGRFRV
jgi:hypothetical protein